MAFAATEPLESKLSGMGDLQRHVERIIQEEYANERFKPVHVAIAPEPDFVNGAIRVSYAIEDHSVPYAPDDLFPPRRAHTLHSPR